MAEPIPSANDNEEVKQPTNAEDRKAAAALDALNANAMSQENGETSGNKQPSAAHQDALMKAMGRLEAAGGNKTTSKRKEEKKEAVKKEAEVKKRIKLAAEDVQFLVTELDLSKTKASDLLRAHDGILDIAVRNFIVPSTKA